MFDKMLEDLRKRCDGLPAHRPVALKLAELRQLVSASGVGRRHFEEAYFSLSHMPGTAEVCVHAGPVQEALADIEPPASSVSEIIEDVGEHEEAVCDDAGILYLDG